MAIYNQQQLQSASVATYFTNVYGGISASAVRDLNDSWISSSALLSGSNTFIGNQIISGTMTAQLPANYIWLGGSNGYNQAVATSSISLQGAQGIQGLQGTIGAQGTQGTTGAQGITGSQGIQGTQGLTGAQGIQGITGLQGIQGTNGLTGSNGAQGTQGIQGLQGLQGIQGADNSTQGTQGVQGFTGTQGIQGIQGTDNSTQGAQGTQGVQGSGANIDTGSFAITGSNTFIGQQIISGAMFVYDSGSDQRAEIMNGQISRFPQLNVATLIPGLIQDDNGNNITIRTLAGGLTNGGYLVVEAVSGSQFTGSVAVQGNIDITGQYLINGVPISGGANINTGSLLVTASFASTNITFTKGDATTFKLGGFATTGSNTFRGEQVIDAPTRYGASALTIVSSSLNFLGVGGRINFPNGGYFLGNPGDTMAFNTDGVGQQFEVGNSASTSSKNLNFLNRTTGQIQFQNLSGSIQFIAASGISITGSNLSMQGFAYPTTDGTSGQVLTTNGSKTLSFTTVSGGTTYNNPTLNPYSGSLILVANTFTSSSFAHISASANGQVNLIFKNNNNTATTTISGSNNIFTNPTAPGAGFKRFIGGSGNLMLNPAAVNQISASQAFSITTNFNIHTGGSISTRAAVSASAWNINQNMLIGSIQIGNAQANAEKILGALSVTNNQVGATLVIAANRTAISASTSITNNALIGGATTLNMASSSIAYNVNVGNASITNGFQNAGATTGNNSLQVQSNWFGAAIINVSGSDAGGLTNPRVLYNNYLFDGFNEFGTPMANLSLNGSGSSMVSTIAMGQELGITGSNGADTNVFSLTPGIGAGSAFFGRWNSQSGNRARTAETVFAVGTGTSTSLTKTGFLIDSGSNSYFEGTLNVSGSTSFTGSVAMSSFTTLASVSSSLNFADDTAAAAGGVPLGGLYRNGNFVMIRLT